MKTITLPELKEGEIYAGIILNGEGAPSHHKTNELRVRAVRRLIVED